MYLRINKPHRRCGFFWLLGMGALGAVEQQICLSSLNAVLRLLVLAKSGSVATLVD